MTHIPDPDTRTMTCRRCGQDVEAFSGYGGHFRHARGPRCGAQMRYGETCARYAGHSRDPHSEGHRTRYAMDNQMLSRRAA